MTVPGKMSPLRSYEPNHYLNLLLLERVLSKQHIPPIFGGCLFLRMLAERTKIGKSLKEKMHFLHTRCI